MVFSSFIFLLLFLPATLFGYYLIKEKLGNFFLLLASLFFYAWGDTKAMPILLGSIVLNYLFALLVEKYEEKKKLAKFIIIIMLIFNVGLLFTFKYLTSVMETVFKIIPGISFDLPDFILPLGISFFTFSAISYVLDVYFGASKAEKNIFNVALFITFFPKMISGPIMSWEEFKAQLDNRKPNLNQITEGVERFIIGFGKKVIISDTIGLAVDRAFGFTEMNNLSVSFAWFGILGYLIQLYFDFSGYSDMAVGLGKLFGFELNENFDYPYASKTFTKYWKKWHITLGTWLNHYVYTPILRSMSKKKNPKTGKKKYKMSTCDYTALIISWIIIGSWHGAELKYLLHGILNCILILTERIRDEKKKKKQKELKKQGKEIKTNFFMEHIGPHIYFFIGIVILQTVFRADSVAAAFDYYKAMLGLSGNTFTNVEDLYWIMNYVIVLILGIVLSIPWFKPLTKKFSEKAPVTFDIVKKVALLLVLVLAMAFTAGNTYNAFIYFQF